MVKTIKQNVVFKNTTTAILYDLYMNEKKHSQVTGSAAKITTKTGSLFSAYGGYINGKNIHLVKNKLIVQTWKVKDWDRSAVESTFIINLEQTGKDVLLHMVHANLPENAAASINKGWKDHYWKLWKYFLSEAGKKKLIKKLSKDN